MVKSDRINPAYLSIVFLAMVPVSPADSQYDRGTDFAVNNKTELQIHCYGDEFDALLSAGGARHKAISRHSSRSSRIVYI